MRRIKIVLAMAVVLVGMLALNAGPAMADEFDGGTATFDELCSPFLPDGIFIPGCIFSDTDEEDFDFDFDEELVFIVEDIDFDDFDDFDHGDFDFDHGDFDDDDNDDDDDDDNNNDDNERESVSIIR